jgi:pentatricopeptide repeat protein
MQNPTQAEDVLKKSTLEGREYSWNLLIKYYAKLGNYTESERVYQLVFDLRTFLS